MEETDRNLSIVVPVYNSQDTLPVLVEEICSVLDKEQWEYEIILVNDGSQDKSWQTIQDLTTNYPSIRAINLMRNYGQHNSLLCGIRYAKNEITITLDDDLQHPPVEIPKLLKKIDEGFDVVYGAPVAEKHSFWRNITSKLIKFFLKKAMRVSSAQNISAFRAFRTEIRNAFSDYKGTFVSIDVLLSWGTNKFTSVTVSHNKRLMGKSRYTIKKLLNHAFTLITGFSIVPLQVSTMLGFFSIIFGFIILVYVIVKYLSSGGVVPGFTFLASTLAIFSGIQLFAIGMIGEYLGRLFTRSLDFPQYTIRSVTSGEVTESQVIESVLQEIVL
jgi:undecaprenyl-phosphate 4-deoxy-4-formamido-L-arabinose transferase